MKTIKIKTKRFKTYRPCKVDHLSDYSGSGEKWQGAKYDPSIISDNSPDQSTLPLKTGYRTKSIKEGV